MVFLGELNFPTTPFEHKIGFSYSNSLSHRGIGNKDVPMGNPVGNPIGSKDVPIKNPILC